MEDQLGFLYTLPYSSFDVRIASLLEDDAREEIIDETDEEGFIFIHQFAEVHVTQHSHHNLLLAILNVPKKGQINILCYCV